ncbi:MAG: hypothetical protein HC921_00080 [Synechococcaceae cyanobacterium SM2_3_1]|nr:hypothetical protein [Synechococcaceae cyanobacterium SM2_3_1]
MIGRYRLAKMSPGIRGLTYRLWGLPLLLGGIGFWQQDQLLIMVAVTLVVLFTLNGLGCRPSHIDLTSTSLHLVFPLWQRVLPLQTLLQVRLLESLGLKQELGWAVRIGVGGLGGTFGWLWTQKRGLVEVYLSASEELVLVERQQGFPLLITPENLPQFVQDLERLIAQNELLKR